MPRSRDRPVWPATAGARIALVADCADWHTRELTRAFAALGARAALVTLPSCAIETERSSGLMISGFADGLPDAVVVRTMSGGTFEAVTMRLGILHALRELGVLVWNDARAIERCVDKSMTSFLLARAGIDILYAADGRPMVLEVNSMPAWAGVQKVAAADIAAVLAADLVAAL